MISDTEEAIGEDPSAARGGSVWGWIVIWALLFQVLCLVYLPGLHGPFVFDDHGGIVQNEDLRHAGEPWRVLRDHESSLEFDRRPVTALSFLLNYQIAELRPFGYRIVNLILHWLAAMALALVVNRIATRLGWTAGWNLGVVVAVLWMFHPIATNVTTYIYQRSELLMTLFYFLALYSVLRAGECRSRQWRWLVACYAVFLGSLFSKEVGITLVASLVILEIVCFRWSWREWIARRWVFYVLLLLTALLAAWWFSTGIRVEENLADSPLTHPWDYFKTECGVLVRYLRLVFWPHPMVFFSQPRYVEYAGEWVPHLVFLCLLFGGLVAAGWKWRWLWIPTGVFLFVLAPTSSFFPIPLEPEVPFRMYLPSACVISLVVALAGLLVEKGGLNGRAGAPIAALVACCLAITTFARNQVHRSSEELWMSVVRHEPDNIKAWYNLAIEFLLTEEWDRAAEASRRLLAIGEAYDIELATASGRRIDALIRLERGEEGVAVQMLEALARDAPWLNEIELDLALAKMRTNQLDEAAALLESAPGGTRNSPSFLLLRAELLARQGDIQAASRLLEEIKGLGGTGAPRVRALEILIDSTRMGSNN